MKYYELTHKITGEKLITNDAQIAATRTIIVPKGVEVIRLMDSDIIEYKYNGQPFVPAIGEGIDMFSYRIKEIPSTPALEVLFGANNENVSKGKTNIL